MSSTQNPLRRLLSFMTKYRVKSTVAITLMVVYAISSAMVPVLMGSATDVITAKDLAGLQVVFYQFLVVVAVLFICGSMGQRLLAEVNQQALYDLRTGLFNHMQTLSLNFFDRQPIGQLMSRLSNDTDVIDQFFSNGFQQVTQAILTIIIVTVVMLFLSLKLTLLVYLAVLLLFAFIYVISNSARPVFLRLQEYMSDLNGFAEEHLAGQKVVIAFMQEDRSIDEFADISKKAAKAGRRASFIALISLPIAIIFANLQTVLLLVVGGIMVVYGKVELGLLVSFLGLSRSISAPLSQIFSSYSLLMNASAGASRVFEIMDEKPAVADLPAAPDIPAISGDVDFNHVDFSYVPGRSVLKDNTFHAEPGQVFGLCGPTGAGKSTIINILTRYYDIQSGSIVIDGVKIDEIRQDSLRIQIAQVLQEPFLFSDTIMENLRYARREATDDECIAAAKQAGAYEFIMAQPDGYQTYLTDGGSNLSQGQKQMLTIARAMVANPRLLILDEATSNVDTRTEKLIQAGLLKLQKGKTSFIIAHRLSTIRHSDCILVINQGAIIERGTHDELMNLHGFYHNLYMSQFRGKLSGIVDSKAASLT